MSSTLVPFDTPDEDLPDIAKRVRQSSADCFPTQQTSGGGSRRRKKQSQPRCHTEEGARGPSVESARLKECAGPSRQSAQQRGGTPVVTSSRKGLAGRWAPDCQEGDGGASTRAALRERSEGSDEETENDSKIHVERNAQGNLAVDDEQCGVQEDNANEDISEREREDEEREDSLPDCEDGESQQFDGGDYGDGGENDEDCLADDEDGGEEGCDDMEVDEGAGDRSEGSVQKRKQRSSTSPTGAAAATDSVKNRKGKASTRATKAEKRPMKRKQMVDEGDFGEDAKGVAPRAPSEQTERSSDNRSVTVDTTKCFFLEFDEDGYARKDRVHIQVDVTKILPIPEGDILYNHITLDETLVQSIYDAIHNVAKETNGKWDFMTFILAPIAEQRTVMSIDTDDDKELDMTAIKPKLVPGRPLPQGFAPNPSVPYLLQDKYKESSEDDWGHHILWHEGQVQNEQEQACGQQSTPRSAMGDTTMILKDDDDNVMESDALTEQPTEGTNEGTTNVGSFGSLVVTMAALKGISEMMETEAGHNDESNALKVPQEEVAATTEQAAKGEGSREHISVIDMRSESTGEEMIQDDPARVEGDHEKEAQPLRRSTRPVIKKVVKDA
ncbi:hypothetical protein CBR_g28691 [Chara braunii]|uniref:Uncharacterized protein n=1 Tax=Chara braunii TaxID=69332 RepID=A0A388L9I6_CHABU|nr:hypothetical protein CBR_g28691 [Chara braunii]|eukprot:GBG78977.1 hypothetical protein CBR_g28691 [Chara braunii]